MYLPKLTRPIFSTKMSRFAPACPVIFIFSDLSLSRTPWGTYMNCNKRKKKITTENQKYPVICFFNLHEEIRSDKGEKKRKKSPFLSPSCVWVHAHTKSFYNNIHISVHQVDVLVGFDAPDSQKSSSQIWSSDWKDFGNISDLKGLIFLLSVHQYLVLLIPIPTTHGKKSLTWTKRWWELIQVKYSLKTWL